MKTQIRKLMMPMAFALVAAIGAFATGNGEKDGASLADRQGFQKVGGSCIPTSTECSTIQVPFLCTDGVNTLYDFNGTSCPDVLYQKMD